MNLDFFRPREKFLILEITPKGTNGLFLSVDEGRNVVTEKFVRQDNPKKFLRTPARRVSETTWEGKHLFRSRRRVVAVADAALATTIPIPLALPRERANAKTKITIAELENLIAQAMAKIFNGCRSEAAKRFGADELNAVLVGAHAKHFMVDGKTHTSPVGATGKKISLLLELTFTTRAIFEDLKPLFNSPEGFFFREAPQTHLRALARMRPLPLNVIAADGEGASLYVLERPKGNYAVLYREKLDWSFSSLIKKVAEALAVTEAAAQELYCRYHQKAMSAHAARAFKRIVESPLRDFLETIEKRRIKGATYVEMPHALPFTLPHKHGKATLAEYPVEELMEKFGFNLSLAARGKVREEGEGERAILRSLFYFVEAYIDEDRSLINQKLRRRLHWLAE
ncbi:MAG: hypothetical protein ABSE18_04275 [Minisyncoccia bacterium]